ncbi:MAG: hypothetical protein A2017_01855 [Lentisphaerae bacterium GWF2_44_16]|nr:MAG: hypothetical protein A2017_01855 [Lentisphaerae bacterium GWF2_44_16]
MKTDYFSGLDFVGWGGRGNAVAWTTRNIADYYTLQYAHSGHMHLAVDDDGNLKKYEAPFVWLMYKGRYFRFGNQDGAPWGHYYVAFKGARMKRFLESGLYKIKKEGPTLISVRNPDAFLEKMLFLFECLDASPQKTQEAVHALEGLFLMLYTQDDRTDEVSCHEKGFWALSENIRNNPAREWDFRKEAERLNISYSHFRMTFRKIFECPPQQFLIECRLKKAENLIRNTSKTLQKIADETGIYNVYYLNRLFTRQYHIAPGRYRKEFC